MLKLKTKSYILNNKRLVIAGILVLILLAALLLWFTNAHSYRASNALVAQVRFYGEYRIADGPWQEIIEGEHISSTKGDVTLRGNIHMLAPDGEYVGIYDADMPIAFYTDHIGLTFYESGAEPYVIDHENALYGVVACGENWNAYSLTSKGEEPIEIVIHNPHRFGNENAIDEMLSNLALWSGVDFESGIMRSGQTQRYGGHIFIIVALVILGFALFSLLLRISNSRIIWLIGVAILFAGLYLTFSATGVSLWSEAIDINTNILVSSVMFYSLFMASIVTYYLKKTKAVAFAATVALGVIDGIFFILPMLSRVYFYDLLLYWAIVQGIVYAVQFICLVREWISSNTKWRIFYIGLVLPLVAFEADAIATAVGFWKGGVISQHVFYVLLIAAMFVVLRVIPDKINAAKNAKELEMQRNMLESEKNKMEAELKESRVSIMLSQIQPHFIYNTLGTIERMCLKDPEKAFALVRNFSLYLRGNLGELDSVTPIRFEEELKHVEYYVNIEKVRFPDMNIEYDVGIKDFLIPALSVQPLVENAIKHGLMRLESGGTVVIRSYETPTHFCVEVKDDGVGFDTSAPIDAKKHVGLRNIRGRLNAMVNGELLIESEPGVGTKATIMIPKEVTV